MYRRQRQVREQDPSVTVAAEYAKIELVQNNPGGHDDSLLAVPQLRTSPTAELGQVENERRDGPRPAAILVQLSPEMVAPEQ